MDSSQAKIFVVVKFEPANIILMHRQTRRLYRYQQAESKNNQQNQLNQQFLLTPLILNCEKLENGYIYQLPKMSLVQVLAKKPRNKQMGNSKVQQYQEQQILNTFEPILSYLQQGHRHGRISLHNIVIDSLGEVRLKHPIVSKHCRCQGQDYRQLGLAILQVALGYPLFQPTYKDAEQFKKQWLINTLNEYSDTFIAILWILLNQKYEIANALSFQYSPNMNKNIKIEQIIQQINLCRKKPQKPSFKATQKQNAQAIINERKLLKQDNQDQKQKQKQKQKKIIVIPLLNLNMGQSNKKQMIKRQLNLHSRKNPETDQNRNQNQYESKHSKKAKSRQSKQQKQAKQTKGQMKQTKRQSVSTLNTKTINFKGINGSKVKKQQFRQNYKSMIKRKGKTVDKKLK